VVLSRSLVGAHSLSAQASAYGTAFWVAAGLSAVAIIPCVILMWTEHQARVAQREQASVPPEALAEAMA
jgi:hypothetical protein